MFIFYNSHRDATDPRDEFLATLATAIKKDILTTGLPYRVDNKGGRCIHLPGYYNNMIYLTLGKYSFLYPVQQHDCSSNSSLIL